MVQVSQKFLDISTETFRDNGTIIGGMGRPYGNRRLNKPISVMWHDRGKGPLKRPLRPYCQCNTSICSVYALPGE